MGVHAINPLRLERTLGTPGCTAGPFQEKYSEKDFIGFGICNRIDYSKRLRSCANADCAKRT